MPIPIIVTHPSVVIENNDELDVQDNLTSDPNYGADSILNKSKCNTIKLPNLEATCERVGISDRGAPLLNSSAFEDVSFVTPSKIVQYHGQK